MGQKPSIDAQLLGFWHFCICKVVVGQLWSVDGGGSDGKWLWRGCGSEASKVMEVVVYMMDNLEWQ